jgi:hypothetical protein
MDRAQVHFEVFVRKKPGSGWTLDMATEDRALALATANELIAEKRAAAARVTKESLDPETREFQTVTILKLGAEETAKPKKVREDNEPLCVTPQDLYTIHARERIGRLLEGWLERQKATPFELLHRPDLVEKLEASGTDLQHAIQKVAIPEAQARGLTVHELIRAFTALVERSIEKLLKDHKRGALPDIDRQGFADAAERVSRDPERAYLLGAGVAASIAPAKSWSEKVERLLDLAEAAPEAGPPRALALATIEQPLSEILGSKVGLSDLLGKELDLGGTLAAMARLCAADAVQGLLRTELPQAAQRLARWLTAEEFGSVRAALGRRILRELNGPRRLRPADAAGEIGLLRGLAMALTAAAGPMMPLDDVQSAFVARSKAMVTSEFVEAYLGEDMTAREEAEALVWLVENVIGSANKRQAGRWLGAVVSALRFEKEARYGADTPSMRLSKLAELQRQVGRSGLFPDDLEPIQTKLGELGGWIEADSKLTLALARAQAPALHRLSLLLKLATGEAAPLGPAADRAKAEAMKLVRADETRAELAAASPERMAQVRDMIQAMSAAA